MSGFLAAALERPRGWRRAGWRTALGPKGRAALAVDRLPAHGSDGRVAGHEAPRRPGSRPRAGQPCGVVFWRGAAMARRARRTIALIVSRRSACGRASARAGSGGSAPESGLARVHVHQIAAPEEHPLARGDGIGAHGADRISSWAEPVIVVAPLTR